MHIVFRHTLLAALISLSAGCGGGGDNAAGGVDRGNGGTNPPPVAAKALGSRGVPGGTVAVSSAGAITPGAVCTFHLVIGGGLVPTQVRAWIGADDLPTGTGIQAVPTSTGTGAYDVSLPVPSSLAAGSHVWVRLAFADGSLIETGAEDFPLVGR